MKASTFWLLVIVALAPFFVSLARAEVPREKRERLASVLNSSFRERDFDQSSYQANAAAAHPDERRLREGLKAIHVEIGDSLAGPGKLVKVEEL